MNEIGEQTDYLPRFTFNFRHGSYMYVLPLSQPSLVLGAILPAPPPHPSLKWEQEKLAKVKL